MRTIKLTRTAHAANLAGQMPFVTRVSRVDHRDGAGHLEPAYAASLYARVADRAHKPEDRAFVSGTWSADQTAEESAEEFVMTVTSGEDGGEDTLDEASPEENGGPFVETSAATEFAYGTDRSNPRGATREPFPKS
jgi:hypothetical protein